MSKEIWKDIPGYEEQYQVSNRGRVRSLDRYVRNNKHGGMRLARGKILAPHFSGIKGHKRLGIHLGRGKRKDIHRLVLEAFVGPCPDGMESRHLNGNHLDNRLVNLCWGTHKENYQDMICHGTTPDGERNGHSILTAEDIREIRRQRKQGTKQLVLAKQYNTTQSNISLIVSGARWRSAN